MKKSNTRYTKKVWNKHTLTRKNMHESNCASLWLPVNWVTQLVIVSDHQTNSHSYVCALAPFSSGAVPQRPLKAKELTGQGFKPISSSGTVAITTGGEKNNSLCHPPSKGGFYLCWLHMVFFFFFFQGWEESDSEEFPSTRLSLFRRLPSDSWFQWNVSAFSVSCKNPFHECIYFEKYSKYLFSWASRLLAGIRLVPYALKCDVRCG